MSRGLECIRGGGGRGAEGNTREGFGIVPLASSPPPSLLRLAPFYIQRRRGATDVSEGRLKRRESRQFVYRPVLASPRHGHRLFSPSFFSVLPCLPLSASFPPLAPLWSSPPPRGAALESVDPPRSHYEAIKAKSVNVRRLVPFLLERSIATRRSRSFTLLRPGREIVFISRLTRRAHFGRSASLTRRFCETRGQ